MIYNVAMIKKLIAGLLLFFSLFLACQNASADLPAKTVLVMFSPQGGIQDKIISKINLCRKSIKIAIYGFTSGDIAWALENAKNRGVDVKIVADKSQAAGKHSEISFLVSKLFPVMIRTGKGRGIMHNKFAVFDDTEVVTGSYNWTQGAENYNFENAIFINDPEIARQYSAEFNRLYSER
ncbi:MAG: phospholipase D-like domain-containing protein [Candidatus Margulisiibacteriota bacterium]